jgi:CCR4-NOT transcription complex subunit 7/8
LPLLVCLQEGVDVMHFAELLMTSGLALSPDVHWITFHSGYDFGYLLRLLTCVDMPSNERDFFDVLRVYFPVLYDIKYLMKSCKTLKGGLQEVADELGVSRIGPQHQAGSDSLLTGQTFFKLRSMFFEGIIDNERFNGMLYGLGTSW